LRAWDQPARAQAPSCALRRRGRLGTPSCTAPVHAVLGHARATTPVAGTNLKGEAAGAAWTLLLPSLELGLILCIGAPSAPTLRGLCMVADGGVALNYDVSQSSFIILR
jgi:hypothetical protein